MPSPARKSPSSKAINAPDSASSNTNLQALLLLNGNIDINFIADFLDRQPSTVTTWAKDYQRIRLASLYTGHAANTNASKLTSAQREEIATVLSAPPSARGIPAQFWTVPQLKDFDNQPV